LRTGASPTRPRHPLAELAYFPYIRRRIKTGSARDARCVSAEYGVLAVCADDRDHDQAQPEQHGPEGRAVRSEPRLFMPAERRPLHRQIALAAMATDRHRPRLRGRGSPWGLGGRGRPWRGRRRSAGRARGRAWLRGIACRRKAERVALELFPPRCGVPTRGTRRSACSGHVIDLFLALTGLADGLAPKERRYATSALRPNNLGPPLPPPAWRERRGISAFGRRS